MSTRDVLRKSKPRVHACEVSGGTVYVRALSGAGRAAYLALFAKHQPGSPPNHEIAILGLCDEDGATTYDADNAEDVAEVADVDGADIQKIALKLLEVSGLTNEAAEEAEKKSDASPS